MGWLLDGVWESIRQGLIEAVLIRFANIFDSINTEVGNIATNVGQTPAGWDV